MIETAEEVINTWLSHVNKGDLRNLIELYNEKAILIPTFSNRLLNNLDKIQKYFETLAGHEELSIALHVNTVVTQQLQNDLYASCGIYCWRFAVDGELLSFEARFSFVIDLAVPRPIIQHHSSQIPRTL